MMPYEQQKFAEENHQLVFDFLDRRCLPENDYYDVIIFGYLEAVRDYFTDPSAQKFAFGAIANRRMHCALIQHYRKHYRLKRKAPVLSIHMSQYPDGPSLEETLPSQDELMQQLEVKLLLHDLAARVSKQQMDIVNMKTSGYGIREIARHHNLPMKKIKEALEDVRTILSELCYL